MWKLSLIFSFSVVDFFFVIYSGLYSEWNRYFIIFSSLVIAVLTYFLRRDFQILHHTVISGKSVVTDMYVENVLKKTPAVTEENKLEETK
ncbi:MAG: hypothetical protein WAV11_01180 [Minisyncoccia bacterium]